MAKINKNIFEVNNKISKRQKKRFNKKRLALLPWCKLENRELKINDLPIGVIIKILSYVPREDLFLNIRLVCKKWHNLAECAGLWKTIAVGPEVPIEQLLGWLEIAPKLNSLRVQNRIDAGQILKKVYKYNKNIKQIKIHDCWGCERRVNIPSAQLCNIIQRCPYLDSISLRGSRFISCKFFRILATRDMILEKRKRCIDHQRRSRKIQYYGSALKKQLQVFLQSRLDNYKDQIALISVESNTTDESTGITHRKQFAVKNQEDIDRVLNNLSYE